MPKIMADPNDDISVIEEIPAQPKADVSEPDVNGHAEPAEVVVDAASQDDEAVNADSHEDPRLYQTSLSTCSDTAKDDGVFCGPSADDSTSDLETDDEEVTTVVFSPDHMEYQDKYCADCVLTFTSSCIKIEGSFLDDDEEPFILQWGIEDVLYIKSHWYQRAGMTMLKIRVLMEDDDTLQAENVECPSGTELRFAFIGTDWFAKQEAVTSLNDTYKTLWTAIHESGDTVDGHTQSSFLKYFPCFDQPFEEVIYPKGEIDAVSIGKRDASRGSLSGSASFRKKKLFRKWNLGLSSGLILLFKYLSYHWSLIVMCHLGEVATYQDEDVTKLSKVPCILHMDPIRGNHTGLNGLMQRKCALLEHIVVAPYWLMACDPRWIDCCGKLTHNRLVTHVGLIAVAKGCTNLESLKITLGDISNEAIECLGTHLKNLHKFRILVKNDRTTDLPLDNGIVAMLMGCTKLERLDITLWHGGLTDVGLEYIGKYGANLRSLSLTRIGNSNAGLVKLSEGCPKLRKLKLMGCPFSKQAVTSFVFNMPSLRYVWFDSSDHGWNVLILTRPEFFSFES
nr:probable ubiquitin-like-specific protease 2B isoform X3 [Tanacetum cinerariifolium]